MKKQGNASLQVVQERKYSYRTLHDSARNSMYRVTWVYIFNIDLTINW